MKPAYLIDVPTLGLCHGCGGCSGVCPTKAIEMSPSPQGTLYPTINLDDCTNCGLCFSVCPGHDFNIPYFQQKIHNKRDCDTNDQIKNHHPEHPEVGFFKKIFAGYSTDPDIQWEGQSGGAISALLIDLLERGEIKGAVVTKVPKDAPTKPITFIARTREEVLSCVGSKYGPVSAAEAISLVKNEEGPFVFVGVSCQIHAFRKAEEFSKTLAKKIYAYFGLHCKGIYSTHFFDFLLAKNGLSADQVASFNLRSKEWRGWPADLRIETSDGRIIDLSGGLSRTGPRDYFAQLRCLSCTDKLNEFSDVSFGDCRVPWVYGKKSLKEAEGGKNPGQSDIVARTDRGLELIESAIHRGVLAVQEMKWNDLVVSTKPSEKKLAIRNLSLLQKTLSFAVPEYGVTYEPENDKVRHRFYKNQIWTLWSSFWFVLFWKLSHLKSVRSFYRFLPLQYIHLSGGLRRRLTNYRQANGAVLKASYESPKKPKILPGTCHPKAGKVNKKGPDNNVKSCIEAGLQ